jgi:hypothetical protein
LPSGEAVVTVDLAIGTAAAWLVAAEDIAAAPVTLQKQTAAAIAAAIRLTNRVEVQLFTFITTLRVYFVRGLTCWP